MQEVSYLDRCSIQQTDDRTLLISPLGTRETKEAIAWGLLYSIPKIREELRIKGLSKALIVREGRSPFPVLLSGSNTQPPPSKEQAIAKVAADGRSDLAKQLELIAEQEAQGRIVCITGMLTNLCKHTNDLLLPERGIRTAPYWTGYNYLKSWCINGDGVPSAEYDRLIELLHRDRSIAGYSYMLIRPDDGALIEYSTDYVFIPNWYGEPVRVGFSTPKDYRVVEEGRGDRIIR